MPRVTLTLAQWQMLAVVNHGGFARVAEAIAAECRGAREMPVKLIFSGRDRAGPATRSMARALTGAVAICRTRAHGSKPSKAAVENLRGSLG